MYFAIYFSGIFLFFCNLFFYTGFDIRQIQLIFLYLWNIFLHLEKRQKMRRAKARRIVLAALSIGRWGFAKVHFKSAVKVRKVVES